MNRRDFLTMLGFGAGAVAFKPTFFHKQLWNLQQLWNLPADLISVPVNEGMLTPEWMAAEAMRIFCSHIEVPTLRVLHDSAVKIGEPTPVGVPQHQFGVDFIDDRYGVRLMSRDEFSKRYIQPAATHMAHSFNDLKPAVCFPLMLPQSISESARARNEQAAIDIRYVRAYDIREDRFINRLDMLVA